VKIYTFYEELKNSHDVALQKELISLWKDSWVENGWDPIVLNNDLAESHYYYDELYNQAKSIHVRITGNKISEYGLYCFTRWLAYSMLESEEEVFVCDYDLINNGLQYSDLKNMPKGINLMSDYCPCFCSATSKDFLRLSKFFIEISSMRLNKLMYNVYDSGGLKTSIYHDQDVLVNNLNNQYCPYGTSMSNDLNINFSNKFVGQMNHKKTFDNFVFKKRIPKTLHFSRSSMKRFKKEYESEDLTLDELRISVIREKFANY